MKILGNDVDVEDVEILQRKDHAAEFTLSDGSVIRFTAVPTQIVRVVGQWNATGDPIYIVYNGTVTTVVIAPEDLRRPGT